MTSYKYVILGGGMVAGYAAQSFVEGDVGRGELAIISGDSVAPYERPPLSKGFLAGEDSEDSVFINPQTYYDDHGIGLHLEAHVASADLRGKRLRLASGDEIGFEKLLIATGSVVRMLNAPGSTLDGILYLRSFDDSKRLRSAYKDAKQAIVLGSGFIGMEVASVLARMDVKTTLLFPEDRIWQRFFAPEMSAFFEKYYGERGVTFMAGELAQSFEGEGRVRQVVTKAGKRLPADLVVCGIGVLPAVDAVKDSGLTIDNGVVVNEYLETGIDGVYAAGDVANYHDVIFDTKRRAEHWDNAVEQGKHVAKTMLGDRQPFVHVPYFFSDVFDLSYEFWGDTADADRVVYRGDVTTRSFSAWWLREGKLRAAFVMNRPDEERDVAPGWIAEHHDVDAAHLADESLPVKATTAVS